MPYNLEIPGQVSEFQLKAIEAIASLVPPGGCVVEVGSLFGRSSWAWAKSVPQDATVHCIDPWEGNQGVRNMERTYGIKYGLDQFLEYTKDCPNLKAIQAYSPEGVGEWDTPVDVYYEDAVHTNPILDRNVKFWTSKLSSNGIICGDDYRPRFSDVCAAAERAASKLGCKLYTVDFFWCVMPDARPGSKIAHVIKTLTALGDEARKHNEKELKGTRIQISPLVAMPTTLQSNKQQSTMFRIVNDGLVPWPSAPKGPLILSKKLVRDGQVLAEDKQELPHVQLAYDIPIDLQVSIPFGPPLSGEMILEIELAGRSPASAQIFSCPVVLAETPIYSEGDVIRFSSQGDLPVMFEKGWAQPERQHVWTDGTESRLRVNWSPKEKSGRRWIVPHNVV